MERQEFELAMDELRTAHKLDPEEPNILFFLAEVHAHLGLFFDARKYAKDYLEKDTRGSYAAEAMEIIDFAEQEDWQLFDDDGEAHNSEYYYLQEKARRLMEQGKFPEAIEILEEVIAEKPDFWGHIITWRWRIFISEKRKWPKRCFMMCFAETPATCMPYAI